jgi:hypothetical protein
MGAIGLRIVLGVGHSLDSDNNKVNSELLLVLLLPGNCSVGVLFVVNSQGVTTSCMGYPKKN